MNKIILSNKDDCDYLVSFMRRSGLSVRPYDEVLNGTMGWVCFLEREAEESSFIFLWRFAKKIETVEVLTKDNAAERIEQCLSGSDWVLVNNPHHLQIGFANHDLSVCLYLPISVFRYLPDGVKSRIKEWTEKNSYSES